MKLILIRGLPGSGKTTYAKELIKQDPSLSHYEADMFFEDGDGDYHFDYRMLKDAHSWCLYQTTKDLSKGKSVIVSNTFTQKWEIQPYVDLGKEHCVEIVIKKATGEYENVHGVPDIAIDKMRARWEDIESEEAI